MKKLLCLALLATIHFWGIPANAQNLIAVQNGGAPKFFTDLQEAANNSQSEDTINIPGGSYSAITLDKKLHLIGVGHHPDSTRTTAKTLLGGLIISSGSDGSSIQGISFGNSPLSFSSDSHNLTISRCYFGEIVGNIHTIYNLSLNENMIGLIGNGVILSNASICNNIFFGQCMTRNGYCVLKNNIFLASSNGYYPYSFYGTNNLIENNICYNTNTNNYYNCILRNNLNFGTASFGNGNQGSGNFDTMVTLQSVFDNYDPETMSGDNIYKADFHLKANSPYKNAGTDGTDIGIYGGAYPWKEGSIPSNPHFQTINIAPKTDNSGNLNVKIKVAAQDH